MKSIIFNENKLTDEDIELEVTRVKGLIINSKNRILLAYNNNTFQFPGGHLEKEENMDKCLIREIREETGIDIEVNEKPFLCISTYDNNYFGSGKCVLNKIYYYRIITDKLPDFSRTHYDELELATDFELFYFNFSNLSLFLKKCLSEGSIDNNIGKEMLEVVNVYNQIYGG